jgi:hypothetical protein
VKTVESFIKEPVPAIDQPYGNGNAAGVMKEHLLEFLENNQA